MHKDYQEIFNLCFSGKEIPSNIRLFLAEEKKALYINNGNAQGPKAAFGLMTSMRSDRGSVLANFAAFEFLLIEFIRFTVLGF